MDKWEDFTRKRDDDPYHAWMMHRRLSEEALRGQTSDPGPICPIIIRAKGGEEKTLQSLKISLEKIKVLIGSAFFASAYDKQHLDASLAWIGDKTDELGPKFDYLQYYFVYAYEDPLFKTTSGKLPAIYWDSPYFDIKFVGAGISDIVTDDLQTVVRISEADRKSALTIIDDSFAFLHNQFIDRGGQQDRWKFEEIWFQEHVALELNTVRNGVRIDAASVQPGIDNPKGLPDFLLYQKPYEAQTDGRTRLFTPLNLSSSSHQPLAFSESHGTHVTSRALRVFEECNGDDLNLSLTGVAIPVEVTENTSGSTLGSYVLAGIRQAMMWNDQYYHAVSGGCSDDWDDEDIRVPLVINFSYGFLAGMKDGTSKLNRAIAEMIDARNTFTQCRPTALVVPMGNSYDTRSVAKAHLEKAGDTLALDWVVLPDDRTSSFVEVYARSSGPTDLAFELRSPSGEIETLRATTAPDNGSTRNYKTYGLKRELQGKGGAAIYRHAAEWSEWPPEPNSYWTRRVFIALGPTETFDPAVGQVPHGRWKLKITAASEEGIEVLALVQRDDTPGSYPVRGKQSFFDHPNAWQEGDTGFGSNGHASFENSGQYTRFGAPMEYTHTASHFAAIDSKHVFVVGAGQGIIGDGVEPTSGKDALPIAHRESYYASKGPRCSGLTGGTGGPDYSGLADRSTTHRGIYAAGTYSCTDITLGGSSVAAPEFAGLCAAKPELIIRGRDYFTKHDSKNPSQIKPPDGRFGLVKEAIK